MNLLVVFDAVADTRSVTLASDRLRLSPSAVSHALGRLRRIFGDPLFVRGHHALSPTSRAEALRRPVREALDLIDGMFAQAEFDPVTTERPFLIGAGEYALTTIVPDLTRHLRRTAPRAKVVVTSIDNESLASLESGRIDLALLSSEPRSTNFRAEEVFQDRLVGVIDEHHPLMAGGGDRVDLDAFLSHPHLVVTQGATTHDAVDASLSRLGRDRVILAEIPTSAVGLETLRGTNLVMSLPTRLLDASTTLGFRTFPLPLDRVDQTYWQVWHRRTDEDPACAWLRRLVRTLCTRQGVQ